MAGKNDNLVPLNNRTKTEQTRITTMGGIASGEARRRKKTMRELAQMFGALGVSNESIRNKMKELGVSEADMNHDMAVMIGQYMKAEKGDTQAAAFVRDTKGENPKEPLMQLNVGEISGIEVVFKDFKGGKDETTQRNRENK